MHFHIPRRGSHQRPCRDTSLADLTMGWLWLVGSIKLQVSFAKEPYTRDNILQKRPIILSILLTVATLYEWVEVTFGNLQQRPCRDTSLDHESLDPLMVFPIKDPVDIQVWLDL